MFSFELATTKFFGYTVVAYFESRTNTTRNIFLASNATTYCNFCSTQHAEKKLQIQHSNGGIQEECALRLWHGM